MVIFSLSSTAGKIKKACSCEQAFVVISRCVLEKLQCHHALVGEKEASSNRCNGC